MNRESRQKAHPQGGFDYQHGLMFLSPDDPGAGGGAGGAGGAPKFTPPDLSSPEAKAWLDQQTKAATEGLVKNRDTILAEKRKLEDDHKAYREKYAGLDPDNARKAIDKLRDDEERALVAKGDIDGLVKRRLDETVNRYTGQLTAKEKEVAEAMKVANARAEKIRELTVDRELAEAAAKAGVHPAAIPDLLNRARRVFTVNDEGKIQCVDGNGIAVNEQDGKPRTPGTWVEALKAEAPHFFPGSSGAGSRGNTTPGGGGVIRIPRAMPNNEYEAVKMRAEKEGKTLVFE